MYFEIQQNKQWEIFMRFLETTGNSRLNEPIRLTWEQSAQKLVMLYSPVEDNDKGA